MIQANRNTYDAEAWLICERCGDLIEGRNGHEVTEKLAGHRLERHNPDLAGIFVSPYLSGAALTSGGS